MQNGSSREETLVNLCTESEVKTRRTLAFLRHIVCLYPSKKSRSEKTSDRSTRVHQKMSYSATIRKTAIKDSNETNSEFLATGQKTFTTSSSAYPAGNSESQPKERKRDLLSSPRAPFFFLFTHSRNCSPS